MKKSIVALLVLLCALAACSPVAAPAVAPTDTPLPTNTPAPDPGTVKWTFQTEGALWGSPTVQDGTVYIGSDDGNLYALSASSGEVVWKLAAGGIVRSTPALDGGRVFISSDDGFAYAVDATTGAQAWATDIGNVTAVRDVSGKTDPSFDYLQSSPVIADNRLYVGSADGNVYALDSDTGEVVWKFATGALVRATPAVADGVVYIGSWSGVFYALDAQTGEPRWSYEASTQLKPEYLYRPIQTKALVAEGLVISASRKASVFALDIKTGELKWEHSYGNALWVESSPALQDGIVYIGSSGSKYVLAMELETGKPCGLVLTQTFNWGTPARGRRHGLCRRHRVPGSEGSGRPDRPAGKQRRHHQSGMERAHHHHHGSQWRMVRRGLLAAGGQWDRIFRRAGRQGVRRPGVESLSC